ncbi:PRTRC system ThiF family protein [Flavobacterium yafengii]|uniref:PRTRC system ThiF family protein n=1 Tax=Flavobacterium yafengii TaxID=3041253 RepID=UPI0024A9154C|nr:PRTRC system ThiF family protein [Flavobacterium yafengii]MDI5887652.1 PRTRC system ThiF family protein [Flavobacterium yafengii]
MKTPTAMHFADNYLLNPTNPIPVALIGAGGTGSHMLTALAKMNHSLVALGHAGLQVNCYDGDAVTTANQGRQLFAEAELGLPKAVALINRNNRFFGTNWKAIPERFCSANLKVLPNHGKATLYISCVDTVSARFDIASVLKGFADNSHWERNKSLYWMDLGNARHTGQVFLSTIGKIPQPNSNRYKTVSHLPMITDEFSALLVAQNDTDAPSCSLAEALQKQDLFINSTLANMGASLLWKLFREGMTEHRGFFLNLANFKSEPILVG